LLSDDDRDTAINTAFCFQKNAQQVRRRWLEAHSHCSKMMATKCAERAIKDDMTRDENTKSSALSYLASLHKTHRDNSVTSMHHLQTANVLLSMYLDGLDAVPEYKAHLIASTAALGLPTAPLCEVYVSEPESIEAILPEDHVQSFTDVVRARGIQVKEAEMWLRQESQLASGKKGTEAWKRRAQLTADRSQRKLQARTDAEERALAFDPGLLALASYVSDFNNYLKGTGSESLSTMIPLPSAAEGEQSDLSSLDDGN
jgi:hypothetical protein